METDKIQSRLAEAFTILESGPAETGGYRWRIRCHGSDYHLYYGTFRPGTLTPIFVLIPTEGCDHWDRKEFRTHDLNIIISKLNSRMFRMGF